MDYRNITFKQLFVTSFMLIMPVTLWVTTQIMTNYSQKNDILSLFLMLIYALIYVTILYIVLPKRLFVERNVSEGNFVKSAILGKMKVFAYVYVVRYVVRVVFLMYFFIYGCKTLMLPEYSDFLIAIPLFAALIYISGKGLKGYIGFGEVIFSSVVISLALFVICGFGNADFSRLTGYAGFGIEEEISYTICSVMNKGYFLLIDLCMMEFVMYMYLNIKSRKKSMLITSVAIPFGFSCLASLFVISLLGENFSNEGNKSILNVVGAMIFPGGTNARLGILACYLFVIFGIMLIGIHVIFICQIVEMCISAIPVASGDEHAINDKAEVSEACEIRVSLSARCIIVLCLFTLYIIARLLFNHVNPEASVLLYMAAIDLPLSILIPALMNINRKKKHFAKCAAEVIGGIVILSLLTSCGDKSMESVDYLRVVFIRETDKGTEIKLVTDSLEGAKSGDESEELTYSVTAGSLKIACNRYDLVHDKTIDLSHVEYIVVDSWDTIYDFYPELMDMFVTNYVEVICDESLYIGGESGSVREYISNHYEGECLAALNPTEK